MKYLKTFERFIFHKSPDEDKPGNKQFIAFNKDENYNIEGNTHGEMSHAIKHLDEFEPEKVKTVLNQSVEWAKSKNSIFLRHINGNILAEGDLAKKQITTGAMLNTLDLVNDKIMNDKKLLPEELELKDKFLTQLTNLYRQLVESYINGGIDINKMKEEEIKKLISENKKLKFTGVYKEKEIEYTIDFSNSGLLAKRGDDVATLFRIDKKGNDINKISDYLNRGVQIKNIELKKALGITTSLN